jgi:hypothetical protein
MGIPKVDEATTIALEAIRDAAPGLLTVTQAAEKVAETAGVSIGTARSRVRAAIAAGGLLELKPWSRKFFIDLPGAEAAGVGPFYIATKRTGPYMADPVRHVITTDDSQARPSTYGPGNTTYVADPEQIREYVQQLADEKKAEEEKERQAEKEAKEAERKEIARRFPGLNRTLRKVMFVGRNIREGFGKAELLECETRLSDRGAEGKDISERRLHLEVLAWGDENVAILKSILEAGIAAHIQSQPLVECKHCSRRILHTTYGRDEFWWHADTSNASCGKDTDTKAEPAEES